MRRALLSTTALSMAALFTAPSVDAFAAEKLSARVGGYMNQYVGYVSQDLSSVDIDGFDVMSDTEIHFLGSTTLDNGVEVAINVQLEGNTSGDQIDESFLTITHKYGDIILGSENSAMYKLHVAPKSFGLGVNSGDNVDWMSFDGVGGDTGLFRGPFGSTYVEPNRVNDANRITFMTHSISGFRAGASYVPDAVEDSNGLIDRETSLHDGFTLGAQYKRSVGEFGFALSAGWGRMSLGNNVSGDDPTAYNLGASVSYGQVSLGASYAEAMNDTSMGDMSGLNVGLAYEPAGPLSFAVLGFFSERDGSPTANAGGAVARAASVDIIQFDMSYDLGPGVTFAGSVGAADINDNSGFGEDSTAVYGVTSIQLEF
jgi:predicted porin